MADENPLVLQRKVCWLGYGGLIPFLALTPASLLDHQHGAVWSDALYAYGAIILSFIGALHWGLAMGLRLIEQMGQRLEILNSGPFPNRKINIFV